MQSQIFAKETQQVTMQHTWLSSYVDNNGLSCCQVYFFHITSVCLSSFILFILTHLSCCSQLPHLFSICLYLHLCFIIFIYLTVCLSASSYCHLCISPNQSVIVSDVLYILNMYFCLSEALTSSEACKSSLCKRLKRPLLLAVTRETRVLAFMSTNV